MRWQQAVCGASVLLFLLSTWADVSSSMHLPNAAQLSEKRGHTGLTSLTDRSRRDKLATHTSGFHNNSIVNSTTRNYNNGKEDAPLLSGPEGGRRRRGGGGFYPSARPTPPECTLTCALRVHNLHAARRRFKDALEGPQVYLVMFQIAFHDFNESLLETVPYMGNLFRGSEFLWVRGKTGKDLLGLPLDADVLSLYTMSINRPVIKLDVYSEPEKCFVKLTANCRIKAVQNLLIEQVTNIHRHKNEQRNYVCHRVVESGSDITGYGLKYKCCDSSSIDIENTDCSIYPTPSREVSWICMCIYILAGLVTVLSPVFILRIKLTLSYENATKFFRASLKHGITGQRHYVIRISSRQLINLSDRKPFSIPMFLFRLLFHCYGEGRCFIHWWGEWEAQPGLCSQTSSCKRVYMVFWRTFAILVLYPVVFYIALALYLSRLSFYNAVLELTARYSGGGDHGAVNLNINLMALVLIPYSNPWISIWIVFSFICFIYTVFIVSWPTNTLENCLLGPQKGQTSKRSSQHTKLLYHSITRSYKNALHRLAYGDFTTKRHCFRINFLPWGLRRLCMFAGRVLLQIPLIYVAFTLCRVESRLYGFQRRKDAIADDDKEEDGEVDELTDSPKCPKFDCRSCCKWVVTSILWLAFIIILAGYCSAVFITVQFVLNIIFFTLLAIVLNSNVLLPWVCFVAISGVYVNDMLGRINREHSEILRLIDENSPRISAVEDAESVFRDTGSQILKTHNLGAVKFIDGDSTEYVSKELYYGVCSDLKCGWSVCIRRILYQSFVSILYTFLIFLCLHTFSALLGSASLFVTVLAVCISLLPKLNSHLAGEAAFRTKISVFAKIIPQILDKHIRVDRTDCIDETEEALSTYDVRPVGHLEMDIPKMVAYGNLRMWKFPWVVSSEQQSHTGEGFLIALASKLAASAFLSKIVTRLYSPELQDDAILRQWCLLIETCIMEGCATTNKINGVPLESIRIFPKEVQSLVTYFRTGRTIDHVVDNINRELYGPFTKGVLVTIGNTPLAIAKMDNLLFAFNASCHGEQVTDLFGAILIMAEFNTQNLQTIVKFIMDPYSPDTVPVYATLPMEGFVFQSAEVLELESPSV